MCFSDKLRILICEKFSIDLENYVWTDELNNKLMNIQLDYCETLIKTMSQVYEYGHNIGSCGLTSRYFAITLPKAELAIGTLSILKGTKYSTNGNHAWIINEGYIIDPTLRLMIPLDLAEELGYTVEKILAYDSARMLSEYELYSRCVSERNKNVEEYNKSLLAIN